MARGRRKFYRPQGQRRYKKLFVIATEGAKTEPQYFAIFNILNRQESVIQVKCLKCSNHNSSPAQVLERMSRYLKKESLKDSDEAWLVVDRDEWRDDQLAELYGWSQKADNHGFAVSNPKFEYWLLLHFEEGTGIADSRECTRRLKRHLPEYDKGIDIQRITPDRIDDAIRRAKARDRPPCADWPRTIGATVYRLVENILRQGSR